MPESLRSLARSVPAVVRRDYVASTVAHWLSLASGLLLFHLVAERASVAGFAYYQVARGVVATIQPFALIGLVPALHRFLPRAGNRMRVLARQSFLVQVVLMDVLGLAGLFLADDVGRLLGIAGGLPAVRAVIVLAAGNCLCAVAVAALRGSGQVRQANLVWLLGFGLLPLAAFGVTTRIDMFLAVQGLAMTAVAFYAIAIAGPRKAESRPAVPRPPGVRTVLGYGIRRAPGEIALPALFAFPTFYAATASRGGPEAGYVGFVTSAITLVCSLFGMLTPVLLPRLSGFHQSQQPAEPAPAVPDSAPASAPHPPSAQIADTAAASSTAPETASPSAHSALLASPSPSVTASAAATDPIPAPGLTPASAGAVLSRSVPPLSLGPSATYPSATATATAGPGGRVPGPAVPGRPSAGPRRSGPAMGAALGRGLRVLPIAAAVLAAVVSGVIAIAAQPVVHGFLGTEFDDAVDVLRLGLPASIPFAAFYAARPTLDALHEAPVITRLLLGCLVVEIIMTYAMGPLMSPAAAAVVGMATGAGVLGALSYVALLHVVPPSRAPDSRSSASRAPVA